ncbi:MAG TPA: hypothetical protein VN205_11980 [Thermomonas sp.]|nr:hypothetical protein [Thermomonas sp.]
MSWDAFQRGVLAELGHVLYLPLQAGAHALPATPGEVDAAMLARLARAAGIEPEGLQAHPDLVAMSAGLRGNAAAKRALWPRLRGLRRTRG